MRITARRSMGSTRLIAIACLAGAFAIGAGGAAAKGSGPTSIAAGYGSVWVGLGNGDVLALPLSLATTRTITRSPRAYVHGLVARYGTLWVLGDQLSRIDARDHSARTVPGTSSQTLDAVAAGAGAAAQDRSHRSASHGVPASRRGHGC
jgi:hypothetical protein